VVAGFVNYRASRSGGIVDEVITSHTPDAAVRGRATAGMTRGGCRTVAAAGQDTTFPMARPAVYRSWPPAAL